MKYLNLTKLLSPFLISILTVTSLWMTNSSRLPISDMTAPIIFGLIIALVCLIFFRVTFCFPHSYPLVASVFTFDLIMWSTIPLPLNILILAIGVIIGLLPRIAPPVAFITKTLPIMLTIAVIASLISGAVNATHDPDPEYPDYTYIPNQPNIYMIIPDRMPSPTSMLETGIDCEGVVSAFQDMGFVVPLDLMSSDPYTINDDAETTRTMRFLADLLNPSESPVPMNIPYSECRSLIQQSEIFLQLHESGYEIINLASWFTETRTMPYADVNMRYEDVSVLESLFYNELSATYFDRTILSWVDLPVWESSDVIQSVERGRHTWTKDTLIELAQSDMTSTFTFAHIMLPHPPFVYSDWFLDSHTNPDQMQEYIYQIRYALYWLLDLAQKIRAADPSAIIIIQSDEGMAFRDPEWSEKLSEKQWSGVFGAWFVPEGLGVMPDEHYDILKNVLSQLSLKHMYESLQGSTVSILKDGKPVTDYMQLYEGN